MQRSAAQLRAGHLKELKQHTKRGGERERERERESGIITQLFLLLSRRLDREEERKKAPRNKQKSFFFRCCCCWQRTKLLRMRRHGEHVAKRRDVCCHSQTKKEKRRGGDPEFSTTSLFPHIKKEMFFPPFEISPEAIIGLGMQRVVCLCVQERRTNFFFSSSFPSCLHGGGGSHKGSKECDKAVIRKIQSKKKRTRELPRTQWKFAGRPERYSRTSTAKLIFFFPATTQCAVKRKVLYSS